MGISEAIALLTVYVSVQQRTNAEYEIEKIRFQEENLQYEKSLEELLSVSPDALCVFHLNLTKNTRSDEHGTSMYVRELIRGTTVDDLFETITSIITDKDDAEKYKGVFNRNLLLAEFSGEKAHTSLAYHRITDNGESHLIKSYLSMLKNPATGDIEAIVYSVDRDRQEKEEKVISAITNREYDYIALIDATTRKIHYQYMSQKVGNTVQLSMGDYDTVMKTAIEGMHDKQNVHFEDISFATVYSELEHQEEYSYVFSFMNDSDTVLQKKIMYRYLDEKKNEILFFRIDITEEMRQEHEHSEQLQAALLEAQHANAMKSEFLSNVSHDMRTPLNAVVGYTDLAKKSKNLNEVEEYLDKLERAGKIILSLVNDTLDLTKIESGAITLKPAPISCGEVIKKIISTIQPSIDEKHIHFMVDNARAVMATINVDALRLQDIFINLLSNAVKFTPENGEITLVVECTKLEPKCVHDRIIVRDNGCGMSPEFLPKAFEPFSQERLATTANVGGSGLGLSIVKKLVELMGGTISVKSELGKGTEFTVYLDFERVDETLVNSELKETQQTFADLSGRNILLVEDNEMNTEIAKAVLEMKKMEVTCASNGQIACDIFAQSKPGDYDVILMDIRMPVMNGLDAAKTIRKMARADAATIPIIAMSANAFDDDIRASFDAGMNGHIAKPVNPEKLYEALAKLMKN